MKIGIDAKWYFRGPPSGRRVIRNLVKHLVAQSTDDELHLFTDADSRHEPLDVAFDARRRHHVWAGNNQVSNVAVLPRVAEQHGLDAVVYQNFVPPRRQRHARIAFVHDAIFQVRPEFFTRMERLYFKPLRYLARSAERMCTVSHAERARLIALGYARPDRIDVVPNAVDDAFLHGAPPLAETQRIVAGLGLPGRFFLFVGRVTARKNVGALVRALEHIPEPVALVVAGPSDETASDFTRALAASTARHRIHLLGALGDDALRAVYAAATVFCFPSLDESFGLPPLEAMALGTPCVVSDVPALREVCGGAALYVDPNDPVQLGDAIKKLLSDNELCGMLEVAGRAQAAQFSWERSAAALLACAHATARAMA
ncbi:MAG: glycosyltransferase family 1 protein [Gemmatimonadaceae bacterium]